MLCSFLPGRKFVSILFSVFLWFGGVFFSSTQRYDVGLAIFKHMKGIPPEEECVASLFVKLSGIFCCCCCSHYSITLLFVEFHWKLTSREHLERVVRGPGR